MKTVSIKTKLIHMQLLLAFVILLAASLAFSLNDLFIFKRSVERSLASTARILSENLAPTLAFADKNEANKILSSLQSEPSISTSYLLDSSGSLFAEYGKLHEHKPSLKEITELEGPRLNGSHLIFYHRITQNNELKGYLYLNADLKVFAIEYKSYFWVITSVFLAGLLMSFGLAHLIQRSLSEPIINLAVTAKAISISGKYSFRMEKDTAKEQIAEISTLSTEFNQMLDEIQTKDEKILAANTELEKKVELRTQELKEIQKTALQNAHAAGMAEVATGILHNIGNIINSVNTSVDEISGILQKSKIAGFMKANEILKQNASQLIPFLTTDPKGKLLPEYYLKIGGTLKTEHAQLTTETEELVKKVSLIKDVIQTQQEYAKKDLFFEELSLASITDEILNLLRDSLSRHDVEVVRKYRDTPRVRVQRIKFAHILMNIIKNAKEAMVVRPSGEKILQVEIDFTPQTGVLLRITDSGEGISAENLEKIFNHGFTTKQSGHGFGLHFCANAMTEMGGSLLVESKGLGHGASFLLSFAAARQNKEVKHA